MPTRTQPTPRQQASQVSAEMTAIAIEVLNAQLAAAEEAAVLSAAGLSIESLTRAMAALYGPLVAVRIFVLRRRADSEFTDALPTTGPTVEQVQAFIQDEIRWERIFVRRSSGRIAADLRRAARKGLSGQQLDDVLENALDRERRFNMMRQQAAERRLTLRIEEASVQSVSPQGAYWVMDPSKRTHTQDCMAMAGHLWSWEVLRYIRPSNRHAQCGCHLLPAGLARANGFPNADVVRRSSPPGR